MESERKLVRPADDRMLAGVCSGFARYFGIDPTLVRVGLALAVCIGGTGVLAYLICWIVIPEE
jgi:phage shock protein PspC (stress-responsive transcriptional regulator)